MKQILVNRSQNLNSVRPSRPTLYWMIRYFYCFYDFLKTSSDLRIMLKLVGFQNDEKNRLILKPAASISYSTWKLLNIFITVSCWCRWSGSWGTGSGDCCGRFCPSWRRPSRNVQKNRQKSETFEYKAKLTWEKEILRVRLKIVQILSSLHGGLVKLPL